MRIGVLTGGGDCPGLNAAIRAVVARATSAGWETLGIRRGWAGVLEEDAYPLAWSDVKDILNLGGTILSTSRTNPYARPDGEKRAIASLEKMGIDALVAIGGDDTLTVASNLAKAGVRCVGVPKTIDNDIYGTDFTIGFDTAANVAVEALDRLHTTAKAHGRIALLEVMGRDAGWLGFAAGIGGGAHLTLIPEIPFTMQQVCDVLAARKAKGRGYSIVVVSEGVKVPEDVQAVQGGPEELDEFGHPKLGGISEALAGEIGRRLGEQVRATVLGYVQRGGTPTLFDRHIASRMGLAAVDYLSKGRSGVMAALQGPSIVPVPLSDAVSRHRGVPPALYEDLKALELA